MSVMAASAELSDSSPTVFRIIPSSGIRFLCVSEARNGRKLWTIALACAHQMIGPHSASSSSSVHLYRCVSMSSSFLISSCSPRRFASARSRSSRQRTAQARQLLTDLSVSLLRTPVSVRQLSPHLTRHGHLFPVQCQRHRSSLHQHSSHLL